MDDATQCGAGGPKPDVAEAKEALRRFVTDFKTFQERIETKMKTQEDRIAMLDRRAAARPALSAAGEEAAPHRKALGAYLRSGDEAGLRQATLERKALTGATGADGGFLLDHQTAKEIAALRKGASSLRAVANVVAVEGASYEVLVDLADLETAWLSQTATMTETATSAIERISIPLHELAAAPKVSQRLLDDSGFDIESWLAAAIAERFARAEAQAFVSGDGMDKPLGFLSYPRVANDAWEWGRIGYVATGLAGAFNSGDPANDLVDLVYALGARYRANGAFVMNSKTAGAIRKMKDAEGRFLWHESLGCGEPALLMGYPVVACEAMPDIAPDAPAVAFGDFRAGYTIAERQDLRILRDPFSAKPHVQFYASARVGGGVTDFAAIKVLKFGVA